ncbi:MAG: transposase [Muribaculaceae bacterium]|nr:transposase [Muribaculaceae bacterium]
MGQHVTLIGTSRSKTASGYRSENALYRAQNCKGCQSVNVNPISRVLKPLLINWIIY